MKKIYSLNVRYVTYIHDTSVDSVMRWAFELYFARIKSKCDRLGDSVIVIVRSFI